ncbi:MAG TPA: MFS transporter, partial [Sphaerochaeta sp.]|nr:MFS transporter [Sphaerochaeta sp.]
LWTQVAKKLKNNQLMLIICALFMTVFAIPLTFVQGQMAFIITMALWGLGFGGFWTFMSPAMADVVDNLVVKQQRRDDGVILGIRAFFMRFSYASQAIVFFTVHTLTKFDPDAMTPLAKLGIQLHMGVIPAAFFLTGAILFAKMNRLTPEKVAKNHVALAKMDI